jgi:CO/xanthine dehydrogenase Mo-binding subunit
VITKQTNVVGKALARTEGVSKVTGQSLYIDDMTMPGMIFGVTVRSSVARGRIKSIKFGGTDIPWNEITVVTSKDIPGKNYVSLILNDQPYLAAEYINHPEEAVLLLAHADKHLLEKARRAVVIEVEPAPAVFNIADAECKKAVVWGESNEFKKFLIDKGNVDEVWDKADHVIEGEYFTGAQEQLYIENNGVIATYDGKNGVAVWGSLQCPYYVHKALMPLFDLPADKVRVIQAETGGGFGGKEEYPSMIAGHAALLAMKAGRPVKLIYDRAEDLVATTKRHPSRTRHKTAVSKDGKLLAMDIEFVIDGGAYATLSAVVLSRGTIHAAGPYACPNVRIRSRALATNTPPHGAFRGFGAPQSVFAIERHMNKIAQALGMAPEVLREKNFLKDGLTTATEQEIKDHVDMSKLQARALDLIKYHEKVNSFAKHNLNSRIKKGVGFATFMHGAGFTGSGERMLKSVVHVTANGAGILEVRASSTEIGQGTNTIFKQIVAEVLSIDPAGIEVVQPDTHVVPNSGPTVASRTVMVVGKLVKQAALDVYNKLVKAGLIKAGYSSEDFKNACKKFIEMNGSLKGVGEYLQPPGIFWDDEKYRGEAYATYAWAVYAAEVSVDTATYEVTVDDFVAVQEIGKVVHPILAAGQIEGGVVQGIGFALYEKVVWREGRMANGRLTNYVIPTAADVPEVRVFFEESPTEHGPYGAKGIGELPLDGTAPAILNAIEHATSVAVNHVPLLPEDLMKAFAGGKH